MKRRMIDVLFLVLLMAAIALMTSCSDTSKSDDSGKKAVVLNYRIAGKNEGAKLMLSNDAYYDGMTQNDLDFKMQKTDATMDEYKSFAKKQVIDFTDEQKSIIKEHKEGKETETQEEILCPHTHI